RMYNRIGPRKLAVAGLAVLFVTTGLLSRTTGDTSLAMIAMLASMRGIAMGLCMMPVQTAAYNTVPQEMMTRATAVTNLRFRLFGSASTAMLTAVLALSLHAHGAPAGSRITSPTVPSSLLAKAFDDAFLAMAIVCVIGMALSLGLRDRVIESLRRERRPAEHA